MACQPFHYKQTVNYINSQPTLENAGSEVDNIYFDIIYNRFETADAVMQFVCNLDFANYTKRTMSFAYFNVGKISSLERESCELFRFNNICGICIIV